MIALSCLLLTAAVAAYVFWFHDDADPGQVKTRLAYLFERKEVLYENLRDLNFEFKAGKMAPRDYHALREEMEGEAARVLAEISQLEGERA